MHKGEGKEGPGKKGARTFGEKRDNAFSTPGESQKKEKAKDSKKNSNKSKDGHINLDGKKSTSWAVLSRWQRGPTFKRTRDVEESRNGSSPKCFGKKKQTDPIPTRNNLDRTQGGEKHGVLSPEGLDVGFKKKRSVKKWP